MKSQFLHFVFITLCAVCVSSCVVPLERVFSRHGMTLTKPNKDEIVGVWVADEATLNDMQKRGKYVLSNSPKFIFQDDGNFKMEDMPDWWRDGFGESHRSFETNSGKWKLSKESDCCWEISLDFPNLGTGVGLREHRFSGQPKYIVTVILGDPDSGNEMIFVKQ